MLAGQEPTGFDVGDDEAEQLLRLFRERFDPLNLFVDLAPTVTAAVLRVERPMVFVAIMFATMYHDRDRQRGLARAIVRYISEQVFQQGRRTLQILQGVVIFVHWYATQLFTSPPLVTNLLHVLMALTSDLGLEKLEGPRLATRSPLGPLASRTFHGPQASRAEHSMDERRALAACFFITSSISTSVNMLSALPYSAQMEDSCRVFERADVASKDFLLAKLVRLQHIISRIFRVQKDLELGINPHISILTWIRAFRDELAQYWAALPDGMRAMGMSLHFSIASLISMDPIKTNEMPKSSPSSRLPHGRDPHV